MQDSARLTPESTRCPSCGALNPASAEWCGQCLGRFESAVEETTLSDFEDAEVLSEFETPAVEPTVAPVDASPVQPDEDGEPGEPIEAVERAGFRVSEEGITWTCNRCETVNEFEASACVVCGTTFASMLKSSDQVERPSRDAGTAAMLSLFFPGAGHAYVGLWSQAIARAVLSVWVLVVVLISVTQGGEAGSTLITLVYGMAAVGLWLVAAHDAYREATNMPRLVLLKGRMFLWLVVGLVGSLVALMMLAAMQARG